MDRDGPVGAAPPNPSGVHHRLLSRPTPDAERQLDHEAWDRSRSVGGLQHLGSNPNFPQGDQPLHRSRMSDPVLDAVTRSTRRRTMCACSAGNSLHTGT